MDLKGFGVDLGVDPEVNIGLYLGWIQGKILRGCRGRSRVDPGVDVWADLQVDRGVDPGVSPQCIQG